MSRQQANAFLRRVAADPALQRRLRASDAVDAAAMAQGLGFEVSVGDLTRDKARATSWQLTDPELELVARLQPARQPFWWQYIWPPSDL